MKPKTILVIDGLLGVTTTRVIQRILGLHIVSEMSLVLSGPVTVEDAHLFDIQRTIAEIEVMKLCPRLGCNSPQLRRPPKKQADWLISEMSLVLSGPVTVEDAHLFDIQRTIAEIEVMKLCPRLGCNSPQLRRPPKKQADWLIRKIGRTGRRESSRSSRAHVQQTRRNNRSARR